MAWLNAWQRVDAINATNEIIGDDGSLDEYNRVLGILERSFGVKSNGIRVAYDAQSTLPLHQRWNPLDEKCDLHLPVSESEGGENVFNLNGHQLLSLMRVAKAAAVLFRPPYRRFVVTSLTEQEKKEIDDFRKLRDALNSDACPVDIGEVFT